ncbi:MAG: hypothetical protein WCD53_17160 [Microcoleus sp.]
MISRFLAARSPKTLKLYQIRCDRNSSSSVRAPSGLWFGSIGIDAAG